MRSRRAVVGRGRVRRHGGVQSRSATTATAAASGRRPRHTVRAAAASTAAARLQNNQLV